MRNERSPGTTPALPLPSLFLGFAYKFTRQALARCFFFSLLPDPSRTLSLPLSDVKHPVCKTHADVLLFPCRVCESPPLPRARSSRPPHEGCRIGKAMRLTSTTTLIVLSLIPAIIKGHL